MTRVVLYSAIYGPSYDAPKPVIDVGAPCVLYTDNPDLKAPGWEIRVEPLEYISTPMLRAKWWKIRSEIAVDADVSLWIDGSMTPVPGYAQKCLEALGDHDLALTPHPWRTCIYTELAASTGLAKYNSEAMHAQIARYRELGHPIDWGLFASGAIARRHSTATWWFGELWWHENVEGSWQDQLSLPFVLRSLPDVDWVASLPWAQWWGITDHGVGV